MPSGSWRHIPIPATPGDLTPGWVTAALRAGGVVSAPDVTSITTDIIGEERGFTGVVARLRPTYASAAATEAPASIIAKLPMAERSIASSYRHRQQQSAEGMREFFTRCAREVQFYQGIAPTGSAPTPNCYFSAFDEDNQRIGLLLEDLASAQPGDVLTGCTPAQVAAVLEAIAPFHARWWTQSESTKLTWLPLWIGDYSERQAHVRQRIDPFLARYGAELPISLITTIKRLGNDYSSVLASLDRAPATMVHADLHLDNVMFRHPRQPPAAVILDWQSVALGPAAIDIAPFIAGSLRLADQGEFERLLRHYHRHLVGLGIDGYAWERFHHDCRLALLRQVAGIVGWLAQIHPAPLSGRERALVAAALGDGRVIAALQAIDAPALLRG